MSGSWFLQALQRLSRSWDEGFKEASQDSWTPPIAAVCLCVSGQSHQASSVGNVYLSHNEGRLWKQVDVFAPQQLWLTCLTTADCPSVLVTNSSDKLGAVSVNSNMYGKKYVSPIFDISCYVMIKLQPIGQRCFWKSSPLTGKCSISMSHYIQYVRATLDYKKDI